MRHPAHRSSGWLIGIALICALLMQASVGVLAATPTPKPPPRTAGRNTTGTLYGIGIFRIINSVGVWALRSTPTEGDPTNTFLYGQQGDAPLMCDWDGNGTRTPGIFRIVNGYGVWAVRNSNSPGKPDSEFLFGQPGDIPLCGDWTGQGKQTVGVFRVISGVGVFALRNSNTNGDPDIFVVYGQSGDVPVVGDWIGQGKQTVGVFRTNSYSSGDWVLRNSNTNGAPDLTFTFGDRPPFTYPIPGDWYGQGIETAGDFEGWNAALWNVAHDNATTTNLFRFHFGQDGDIPLTYK